MLYISVCYIYVILLSTAIFSVHMAAHGSHLEDMWHFAAGTCLTVLLFPFFVTILLYVAVELFILVEKYDNMNIIAASITDRPPPPPEEESPGETDEGLATPVQLRGGRLTVQLKTAKYIEANVYDYKTIRRVDPKLFQSMNTPAVVMTFFSCTCYSLCLLACEYVHMQAYTTLGVSILYIHIMATFQQDTLYMSVIPEDCIYKL